MIVKYLTDCGIEYEAGLARCLGKEDFYEKVLKAFLQDELLSKAQKAFKEKNMADLRLYVHEIKGSTGNLSITPIYNVASDLNNLLRDGNYTEKDVKKAYKKFESTYLQTLKMINKAFKE